MSWYLHNPIADMYGPYFLLFFGVAIAAVVLGAAAAVRSTDATQGMDPPPLPKKPDPLEVAYLRGGANEVTRLLVFDLIRRGYLQASAEGSRAWIAWNEVRPAAPLAGPLEDAAFKYFATTRDAQALFRPGGLAAQVEGLCEPVRWRLHDEQLLSPAERYRTAVAVGALGALAILGLGGYKLGIALARGHANLGFLILMSFLGVIVLAVACHVPRMSSRGHAYLARLAEAFEGLKARAEAPVNDRPDPALLLVPALFGMAALTGTSYTPIASVFRKASSDGGGCGAGCGSGCGGCGGGCGGCGS